MAATVTHSGRACESVAGPLPGLSIHFSFICDNTAFCTDAVYPPSRYVTAVAARVVRGTSPKNTNQAR